MLTQSLPIFIGLFVVASIVGIGCYYSFNSIRDKNPLLIGFWVLMMVCAASSLLRSLLDFSVLLLMLLVATAGAAADRKNSEKSEALLFHLWRMCLTILFSLFIGLCFLFVLVIFSLEVYLAAWARDKAFWFFVYGLATWPVVPPILLFLLRNSKLRPGIDRHLNDGDEPM